MNCGQQQNHDRINCTPSGYHRLTRSTPQSACSGWRCRQEATKQMKEKYDDPFPIIYKSRHSSIFIWIECLFYNAIIASHPVILFNCIDQADFSRLSRPGGPQSGAIYFSPRPMAGCFHSVNIPCGWFHHNLHSSRCPSPSIARASNGVLVHRGGRSTSCAVNGQNTLCRTSSAKRAI